jgi:hypothetical protein
MNPVIFIGCFIPIVLIWIAIKLIVWIFAINKERQYIDGVKNIYIIDPYADVDEEEEEYGDLTDYR